MKAFGGFAVALLFVGIAGFVIQDKNPQIWEWKQNSNVVELNVGTSATSVKAPTFTGALTGAVTGNVTGNVTGDVTGDVVGAISGSTLSGTTLTLTSTFTGNSSLGGVKTWGTTVSNPDTLVISGVDSTDVILVDVFYQLAADTLGSRRVYAATNTGKTDTVFVYQTTSDALRRIKYRWLSVKI